MACVQKCCCCCSLTQGTIGAGIVTVVDSLIFLGFGILMISYNSSEDSDIEVTHHYPDNYVHFIGYYLVVQESITLFATAFLFMAVKTKNRRQLLPWLIVRGITLKIYFWSCVRLLAEAEFVVAGIDAVWMIVMGYLFVVVYSYYKTETEWIATNGEILVPAPTAHLYQIPQHPRYQYGFTNPMDALLPKNKDAGPSLYPTQSYTYAPQPYENSVAQGESTQPCLTKV